MSSNNKNTQLENMNSNGMTNNDDVDLGEMFSVLWQGRILIFFVILIFATGSVTYALLQDNIYRSEALLSPVNQSSGGAIGRQFGSLASIAGVNLGSSGSDDKTAMALHVVKSRTFLNRLVERYELMPSLMAAQSWDKSSNELTFDIDLYNSSQNTWELIDGKTTQPTQQATHKVYLKMLEASQDSDSGFVTISFEHLSPTFAKFMVDTIVNEINEVLRNKDIEQAERSTSYLKQQISETSINEIRSGIFELIQEQTKTIMLAKASPEYVFKTIDPAIVSEEKFKPKRGLICVLGTVFGAIFGMLIVLVRHVIRH